MISAKAFANRPRQDGQTRQKAASARQRLRSRSGLQSPIRIVKDSRRGGSSRMPKQTCRRAVVWLPVVFVLLTEVALGQAKAPSAILNQYRTQRTNWFGMVWPYANTLFGLLAVIEFAWSAAVMLLER